MQKKSILFILALCVGMQFGVSFGSQEPAQSQSWGDWLRSRAGRALSTAKQAPGRVVQAVKNAPSEWWSSAKKETDVMTPFRSASLAGGSGMLIASSLINEANFAQARQLAWQSDWLIPAENAIQGILSIDSGYAAKMGLAVGAAYFVYTYAVQKAIAYYRNKDITREQAVNQIRDSISLVLTNSLAYPTRSSKINALLKRNEFLVGDINDEDGLIDQACSDLIDAIAKVPYNKEHDEPIDKAINEINRALLPLSSLTDRIAIVANNSIPMKDIKKLSELIDLLNTPRIQAYLSVYLRLVNQKIFEENRPSLSQGNLRGDITKNYSIVPVEKKQYSGEKGVMTQEERENYLSKLKRDRKNREIRRLNALPEGDGPYLQEESSDSM